MKKLLLALLFASSLIHCVAQEKIYKDNEFTRVVGKSSHIGYVDMLLFHHAINSVVAERYYPFYDTTVDNTFEKINDSLYRISIKNPSKDILWVYDNLDLDKYNFGSTMEIKNDNSLRAINATEFMGDVVDSILVENGKNVQRLKINKFNPCWSEIKYSITLKRNPSINIITFLVNFTFPKPILQKVIDNDSILRIKKKNPSSSFGFSGFHDEAYKKIETFSFKKDNLLFVFRPFISNYRNFNGDIIQYRLDNEKDWLSTSESIAPSILLENLKTGKHNLQVRYLSGGADILTYDFEVLPN